MSTQHVIKYSTVNARNGAALSVQVNEAIDAGWQPLGGPCVAGSVMYQAMVKYGPTPSTPPRLG